MKIEELIKTNSTIVENELKKIVDINAYGLEKPMAYSLLGGGKRLRPFLVLETYKLFSEKTDISPALPFACSLEMIHTYSLIHDDLPCMDNDDYRRGKLTNHKVFGDAVALLAGDALLTESFTVASSSTQVSDRNKILAIQTLSTLAGVNGMIGGQMLDIEASISDYENLKHMHLLKTGALIKCAVLLGYFASTDCVNQVIVEDLTRFAANIGIAFQIRDDILDKIADEKLLGKPVGSDEKNDKKTCLSYMSIDEARTEVNRLTTEAISIVKKYSKDKENSLSELARYLVDRKK